MSHLLCLNSRDNYPNKCPHICLHLIVKQQPHRRGVESRSRLPSARTRIIPTRRSYATKTCKFRSLSRIFGSITLALLSYWKPGNLQDLRRNVSRRSPGEGTRTIRTAYKWRKRFAKKLKNDVTVLEKKYSVKIYCIIPEFLDYYNTKITYD